MYDVVIIGAGVSGSAIARELSRYNAKVCVVEKEEDVCAGTSKANSGIVHAGYDAPIGSLMARLNVRGNLMMRALSKELDFEFKQNGSLVVCLDKDGIENLEKLRQRGIANGVGGLKILSRDELKEMEPNISDAAVAALYAPSGGIVCPFGLNIALAENAAENGVDFLFETKVVDLEKEEGCWSLTTTKGEIRSRNVVNAAGVYADVFHNKVSEKKINIIPRRGDYCLLDKVAEGHVKATIFQLPNEYGKGVLVAPTTHGNIIVGPTAIDVEDKEGVNTTMDGLQQVIKKSNATVKNLPLRNVITSFAGLRAHERSEDFIIKEIQEGFIDCAGIASPGLTSAPAIGEEVTKLIQEKCGFEKKPNYIGTRQGILNPKKLTRQEYAELIAKKPEYGNIICRCEMITEGEIVDAIKRPLGARSLDGVKRRTRAGMGRCQAGFCMPKTIDILSRELGVAEEDITKNGGKSKIIIGENKKLK